VSNKPGAERAAGDLMLKVAAHGHRTIAEVVEQDEKENAIS